MKFEVTISKITTIRHIVDSEDYETPLETEEQVKQKWTETLKDGDFAYDMFDTYELDAKERIVIDNIKKIE